jgi:hypothetical protein
MFVVMSMDSGYGGAGLKARVLDERGMLVL